MDNCPEEMKMEEKQKQVEEKIETLSAEQLKKNLESDVKAYTKSLENAIRDLENYSRQLDYSERMWNILSKKDAIKRIEPLFNYEKEGEWWDLMHEKQLDKIRQDRAVAQGTLKQFENSIKDTEEALKSSQDKLEKFGGN